MSREGYRYSVSIPEVLYINSYPNNYIFHNKIQIDQQIQREKQIRIETNLQIQKIENEKKSIWKKFCIFCRSFCF